MNIAVRLRGVAPAGGVVLSAALVDALDDREGMTLDDPRRTAPQEPVSAGPCLLAAIPGHGRGRSHDAVADIWPRCLQSAVLPFANLSDEPNGRYFVEGFVEDIVVTLSNLPELLVVSREYGADIAPERAQPYRNKRQARRPVPC